LKFVQKEFSSTLEVKKSKFIAHLCPYNQYTQMLNELKKKHSKARHFVYAYRYLNEFNQVVQNSSDDGEPKGTSGPPALKVLAGKDLINTAVIIVRYFGGIKLGTGGLVKAYSSAVNEVIKIANLVEFKKLDKVEIEVDYSNLRNLEYKINQMGLNIINKEFSQKVKLIIEGEKERLNNIFDKIIKN